MFRNLDAEQARMRLSNGDVAEYLGLSRVSYERKKKTGRFTMEESKSLCRLFKCKFEYLFHTDDEQEASDVQDNQAS